jgi:TetR/AcrR family tetracycline transcriptional repressor
LPLEKQKIVKVGLEVLEAEGFEALSLARIAKALGVQTPALYWHVKNRAELYALMAESIYRHVLGDIDDIVNPRKWLIALGRGLRAYHQRHRDWVQFVSSIVPTADMRQTLLNQVADRLSASGLSHSQAVLAPSAVMSFTLGWSLFEANASVNSLLKQHIDIDAGFEDSLAALVGGLTSGARPKAARKSSRRRKV